MAIKPGKYIGDRQFYRKVMLVAIPIMIQNAITNLVGMLDNIMVGSLGTDPMSGVSIVNQLMFIFNLCVFGGLSGIGIFTAQFYGKGDNEGIRYTVRLQLMLAVLLSAGALFVFWSAGGSLVSLYLHSDGGGGSIQETYRHAADYLAVMYAGLLPFAIAQVYSSTLRNTGETVIPMAAGLMAVAVNLAGNYILIFGKFGAPALGVAGAAIATVISRFAEMVFVMLWTHRHSLLYPFIKGLYRPVFYVPGELVRKILLKAFPLLLNEALWSGGQAALVQNYSIRGLSAVAALNISQTIGNVFNVGFIAMGSAIAIILGQMLGAGKTEEAKDEAVRLTFFSVVFCLTFSCVQLLISGFFPRMYNTSDEIRALAAGLIRISALCMPIYSYCNSSYFILRSGGKTVITFFFDCGFSWAVSIPAAFILSHFTDIPLITMFLCIQLLDLIKCGIGHILVKQGKWAVNITSWQ